MAAVDLRYGFRLIRRRLVLAGIVLLVALTGTAAMLRRRIGPLASSP